MSDLPSNPGDQADAVAAVDVLVVGAGPVGLATACALRVHGVNCRVVDRLEGPTPLHESRALALWARTLEVFDDLGCIGPVLEQAIPMRAVNAYHNRKRLARVEFDLTGLETRYPYVRILPQGQTERILIERLAELGTEVERGMRLTSLEQDASGAIATLVNAHGQEKPVRAQWVVGCDGAHSAVRHALGLAFEGNAYPEAFRLVDGTVHWELDHNEAHMILLSGGGGMAVFPLPGEKQWRLVDVSNASVSDEPGKVEERFRTLLDTEAPGPASLGETKWVSSFRIQRRITDHLRLGRCFVAGDAAHIHSPAGGQGMNTGIQDGHNLAWKLAMVIAGSARETLLDSYESERRPVAEDVLERTDLLTRAVMMQSQVGRFLRNKIVPFVAGLSMVQKKLAREQSELEIDYRKSPIVMDDRSPPAAPITHFRKGPRAGLRCPDVMIGTRDDGSEERLFDFLEASKHTLLFFTGIADATELGEQVGAILEPFDKANRAWMSTRVVSHPFTASDRAAWPYSTIVDREGRLHTRMGADFSTIYLIRPDAYVGYRRATADLEGFREYVRSAYGISS